MWPLAILAALALAGCTVATLNLGATDYKGKPLSDVTAKLGQPNEVRTIAGQKAYIWNVGNTLYACQIRVVMAGDVVDTYEGSRQHLRSIWCRFRRAEGLLGIV